MNSVERYLQDPLYHASVDTLIEIILNSVERADERYPSRLIRDRPLRQHRRHALVFDLVGEPDTAARVTVFQQPLLKQPESDPEG